MPKLVEISPESKVTKLWSQKVKADTTVPNNKPDIKIRGKENWINTHYDFRRDSQKSNKKQTEMVLKYGALSVEIQRMWNVNPKLIPVVAGPTGLISKSFKRHLCNVSWYHDINEQQQTTILGTAHRMITNIIMISIIMFQNNFFRNKYE